MHLEEYLEKAVAAGHTDHDCVSVIRGLSRAAVEITALISRNGVASDLGDEVGGTNSDGDSQKALDVRAEEVILESLAGSGAAMLLSEEQEDPVPVNDGGSLIVAVDPLDGSSNISVNVTIGTIFSILPDGAVLQNGRAQRAAGFFTYGPQTTLVLAFADGGGVACFVVDPASADNDGGGFVAIETDVAIPVETDEFSINAAYANHWFPPVQNWMAEILQGKSGPRGKDYRMRWVGSLVADAWRIFRRGGVFLYPGDARLGQEEGRLRLVYEANPIAFLAEKAGGKAILGKTAVLDLEPQSLHQRVPFIFGSAEEVVRLEEMHRQQ